MTIIPETVAQTESFLQNHPDFAILFSDYTYDRLQSRDPDHALLQLQQLLDFKPMELACANYHTLSGVGCKPTHTVPKMLRTLLVKYFYNYSLRQMEFHLRYNLLIKAFVGYAVFDEGPDHSTISRFENYLILHHPRLFFDTVLKQIDEAFPDDRSRPQIADTFAVHADAAMESLLKRLRHSCQNLLLAFHKADPEEYESFWAALDWERIFGAADEKIEYCLSTEQRHERLLLTLNGIDDCLRLVQTYAPPATVLKWVAILEKILSDELRMERDEAGYIVHAALLSKNKRGKYALFSATDPDATIRNHGPDKKDPGFNGSVTATTEFIRDIRADTGSQPDPVAIPDLLTAQIEHHGFCPPKLIYDQAAGTGKSVAAVRQATNGQTQLVAKPKPANTKSKDTFDPTDFVLSDDTLTLTCPNGRSTTRRYRSGSGDGFNFRFPKGTCAGCLLLRLCRGKRYWPHPPDPYALPTTHRDVFISDYRLEKQALVTYSKTDAFKEDMKLRPDIERTVSILVLHNGARRARFRGLEKVDFQLKMCGMAFNLKRWIVKLGGKRQKKRRRFSAPRPSRHRFRGEVGLMTV
jgi:hypothetical protein